MICSIFLRMMLLGAALIAVAGRAENMDEAAIRQVIEQRRIAWNEQDTVTYAKLLTVDADIVSATGRSAYGRDEVIRLYIEQKLGAYRGATVTSTVVSRIKFVRVDVAVVDAEFEIDGVRARNGTVLPIVTGLNNYVLTREEGKWLISSIRGIPRTPIQGPK